MEITAAGTVAGFHGIPYSDLSAIANRSTIFVANVYQYFNQQQ